MTFMLCPFKELREWIRNVLIGVNFANTYLSFFNFIPYVVEPPFNVPSLLMCTRFLDLSNHTLVITKDLQGVLNGSNNP